LIERSIRAAENVIQPPIVLLPGTDTYADGQRNGIGSAGIEAQRSNSAAESLGRNFGTGLVSFGKQHSKLFPTDAPYQIHSAQGSPACRGHSRDCMVTAGVAETIIDRFEFVYVDHQHAERVIETLGTSDFVIPDIEEVASVRQAGHTIAGGSLKQLFLQLLAICDVQDRPNDAPVSTVTVEEGSSVVKNVQITPRGLRYCCLMATGPAQRQIL
jgi:hypothetical protein